MVSLFRGLFPTRGARVLSDTRGDEESAFNESPRLVLAIKCLLWIVVATAIATLTYRIYKTSTQNTAVVGFFLWSLNATVFFSLFGLYLVAAKVFGDRFYSFLGWSWLVFGLNALASNVSNPVSQTLVDSVTNFVLIFVESLLLYLASIWNQDFLRNLRKLAGWVIQIIIVALVAYWISIKSGGNLFFLELAVMPFFLSANIRVARVVKNHVGATAPVEWGNNLKGTFYGYLSIPLFSIVIGWQFATLLLLVNSVVNGVSLARLMLYEFGSLQNELIQRKVFADIGLLTASIEHDVRSPLGVIGAELELMKTRYQSDRKTLQTIDSVAEQMRRIYAATELATMLRGDAALYQQSLGRMNVEEVVQSAVRFVESEAGGGIVFQVSKTAPVYIRGNAPMLEEVIINILKNSVEAVDRPGGTVEVILRQLPQLALVVLKDNGCGVKNEDLKKLPTLFTTKTNRPNRGLGLFISDRVIKLHGGTMEIRSTEGFGTTVSISLPLWNANPA